MDPWIVRTMLPLGRMRLVDIGARTWLVGNDYLGHNWLGYCWRVYAPGDVLFGVYGRAFWGRLIEKDGAIYAQWFWPPLVYVPTALAYFLCWYELLWGHYGPYRLSLDMWMIYIAMVAVPILFVVRARKILAVSRAHAMHVLDAVSCQSEEEGDL